MGQVVLSHETGRREAARGGPGFEAPGFALQPLSFSEIHFFFAKHTDMEYTVFPSFFSFFHSFRSKKHPMVSYLLITLFDIYNGMMTQFNMYKLFLFEIIHFYRCC